MERTKTNNTHLVLDGASPVVHVVAISQDVEHHGVPPQLDAVLLFGLQHHRYNIKITVKALTHIVV